MLTQSSFMGTMNHRRDTILILSEILSCTVKGAGKCQIIYKVGLSSAQTNKYLQLLLKSELLTASNGSEKIEYKTTPKGRSFLETFDTLTKLFS
jgi:predicted transcriptional regulator